MFKFSLPALTLKASRTLRNMLLIGGAVSSVSFLTAFGSSKTNSFWTPNYNKQGKYTGPINSVSALEDYARSQNCSFLFYDKPNGDSSETVTVKEAREFLTPSQSSSESPQETDKEKENKVLEQAEKLKQHCTENSFVYAKIE